MDGGHYLGTQASRSVCEVLHALMEPFSTSEQDQLLALS